MTSNMRIGIGYDIHRLTTGRRLVLGGVTIPFEKGLLGHSDADVLLHAVCDSILGAAGAGDIGQHFPDTDSALKNISSMIILEKSYRIIREKGFKVVNIDSTIIAQSPKIAPYREQIKKNIARILEINPDCVNIKATTSEGLGAIGKGEGISAMSVAMIDLV